MSNHEIHPEWNVWMLRAINSHLAMRLESVPLIFANQEEPNYAQLEKWVEISFFGPLYDYQNRGISAMIQVQMRAFVKDGGNIYAIDDLTGQLANAATLAIRVPELSKCFINLGVRILPKGRILSPHNAVAAEVDVTYQIQPKE